ncbi:hypothetical protein JVT61DRAFT_14493 [Boletus reticuloceps]|uniref:Uncharacterized protein n=1 Tax=Boletus reticuloceps TaxID=495285 RepID=A0A8I2YW44_9AGAM|nr:hypothetical protein JVT61DRAFT_14493 [Boletus reticuloceps]
MDMEDATMILDIILRPSLQLCKLALGRSALIALRRSKKTVIPGDDTSSTSPETLKKRVRFNEQPITISRRSFFERCRKNYSSSPTRSCLVIRLNDDPCHNPSESPPLETDDRSVYEDCLSDHPGFLTDLQIFDGSEPLDTRSPRRIRRSEFYETETGIATFDRTGYANYCLSRWLDKQREEAQAPKKLVFEDPVFLPWSNPTLSPPSRHSSGAACPMPPPLPPPPLPRSIYRPPRSLPRRIWTYVEDELQNAIVVFIIGLFIHICLFLFLLYDILTRGLIPSDD